MKNSIIQILISAALLVVLSSSSCKKEDKAKAEEKSKIACEENTQAANGYYGGCVKDKALNNETVDPSSLDVRIEVKSSYSPFVKQMKTYGTLFVGMEKVSDEFMLDLAKTYQQMFPQDASLDLKKQQEVLNSLQMYGGTIPVFYGDNTDQDVSKLTQDCSVCDIIMYGVERQTMEVVEHLLHNITDVGLHYVYPEKWAFNNTTAEVYTLMKEAIEKGYYKVDGYKDILSEGSCAVYNRVIVQEFAYWLITSYWNLQESYGPNEDEWTIPNRTKLQELLPNGITLIESTVNKIMKAPSKEILEKLKTYEP